ncbi:HAMP domain-containing sensor histidine kinase [Gorillibacterium sp. sgz500922]|uniref:sensor histidine kinase n=1 Tax=Gorillibacterium sp. sgz500922 TaxID=3446694 RepID=UPI003F67CA79
MKTKWRKTLLFRYLMILFMAFLLWPLLIPAAALLTSLPGHALAPEIPQIYQSRSKLTADWHAQAAALAGASVGAVDNRLRELKGRYPEASLFWVDGEGGTRLALPAQPGLPARWSAEDAIRFMKEGYDADPFTIVAFIGKNEHSGFMVLQVPLRLLGVGQTPVYETRAFIGLLLLMLAAFFFVSTWFFFRLRGRLVRLEQAMAPEAAAGGIPRPVAISREDEIGRLEFAFNSMVAELAAGREREAAEEALRRELIASLSHDLRTPLTVLRSHAFSLKGEGLSDKGRQSLRLMDAKAEEIARLLDDLLSYSLLAAGKYPVKPESVELGRLLRSHAAEWYPVLEQNGMELTVSTPDRPITWQADPALFSRVLDNLLQNTVRHAGEGRYAGIALVSEAVGPGGAPDEYVEVRDKGPGMASASERKGAGLGLAIVELMLREMGMVSETISAPDGTAVRIRRLPRAGLPD